MLDVFQITKLKKSTTDFSIGVIGHLGIVRALLFTDANENVDTHGSGLKTLSVLHGFMLTKTTNLTRNLNANNYIIKALPANTDKQYFFGTSCSGAKHSTSNASEGTRPLHQSTPYYVITFQRYGKVPF
jgi:hypothetical protein